MLSQDSLLDHLQATAAGVLVGMCKSSHWLGLQRDDLVGEGWLAYHRALTKADARKGDPEVYALNAAWHQMRNAAWGWLRDRTGPDMVQVWRLDALPMEVVETVSHAGLEIETAYFLNRLSTRRRSILMSLYYDVHTVAETATLLRLSSAVVSHQRYAALEQLRGMAGRQTSVTTAARAKAAAWVALNPDKNKARHARYNASPARKAANRRNKARSRAKLQEYPCES